MEDIHEAKIGEIDFPVYYHITIMLEWKSLFKQEIVSEFKRLYRQIPSCRLAELFEITPQTVTRWAIIYGLHHKGKRKAYRWGASKKLVINLENGLFYTEIKKAAESVDIKRRTLSEKLHGNILNNTSFRFC